MHRLCRDVTGTQYDGVVGVNKMQLILIKTVGEREWRAKK